MTCGKVCLKTTQRRTVLLVCTTRAGFSGANHMKCNESPLVCYRRHGAKFNSQEHCYDEMRVAGLLLNEGQSPAQRYHGPPANITWQLWALQGLARRVKWSNSGGEHPRRCGEPHREALWAELFRSSIVRRSSLQNLNTEMMQQIRAKRKMFGTRLKSGNKNCN